MPAPVVFGCSGPSLGADERRFFADADPWGFILFTRNVDSPDQLSALIAELRAAVGRNALIFIDQEGGDVVRLRPPHWRAWPAVSEFLAGCAPGIDREEALWIRCRLIGAELAALGIDANCVPLLDVPAAGGHPHIRERALGFDADTAARLGAVACEATLAGGVLPVIKHIPGLGRATLDSHLALPVLDTGRDELSATDFAPFRALRHMPMAMTAHAVYTAIDGKRPATISPTVITEVVRGEIGFRGLLVSDDLCMDALAGPYRTRSREALAAGCDIVLHCNGELTGMIDLMAGVKAATAGALAGMAHVETLRGADGEEWDQEAAEIRLAEIALGDRHIHAERRDSCRTPEVCATGMH